MYSIVSGSTPKRAIFGELLIGFFFNGKDYGGDFGFSLTFPQLMVIVSVLSLPVLPITWFFIQEKKWSP
ncbi:hypothetical protein PsorP6_005719 [Peronosclerospora sorghi]|uniref:Uncharacterized protein n=1 Tax=Peronosclerospora sorghi TaxID=230839 RepID=A0ACC0W3H1_9STRA|nr:hypothetical protein PsorP6_005719 [Peronosclerospora sorghi]